MLSSVAPVRQMALRIVFVPFANGICRLSQQSSVFRAAICERLVAAVLCIFNPNPNGQLAHVSPIHAATDAGIHIRPY
jgi:hypothetical protein